MTNKPEVIIKSKESNVPIFGIKDESTAITFSRHPKNPILEDVQGVPGAHMIHNVLSQDECQQFINLTEEMGYGKALITVGVGKMVENNDWRSNKRLIWAFEQNSRVMNTIFQRVVDLLPKQVEFNGKKWKPYSLNERLRFYRYTGDEVFGPHFDGCFQRNPQEITFLTFLIYLNDNYKGGETTFFIGNKEYKTCPKQGSACIFFHGYHKWSPEHEGSVCIDGTKYALRSDVMYKLVE